MSAIATPSDVVSLAVPTIDFDDADVRMLCALVMVGCATFA